MSPDSRIVPVGRALIALIFLVSVAGKLADWSGTAAYMAANGMPAVTFFLACAVVLELAGGLSVLLGWRARAGAIALIVFIVPATLIFHDFWTMEGMERRINMIMFLKNLAIIGGLLLVTANGPGPCSLDRRRDEWSPAQS